MHKPVIIGGLIVGAMVCIRDKAYNDKSSILCQWVERQSHCADGVPWQTKNRRSEKSRTERALKHLRLAKFDKSLADQIEPIIGRFSADNSAESIKSIITNQDAPLPDLPQMQFGKPIEKSIQDISDVYIGKPLNDPDKSIQAKENLSKSITHYDTVVPPDISKLHIARIDKKKNEMAKRTSEKTDKSIAGHPPQNKSKILESLARKRANLSS